MSAVRRLVFDTSTLVSAALRIDSIPYRALARALATAELCAAIATLDELEQVLSRPKFDRYQSRRVRMDFVQLLRKNARLFDVSEADEAAVQPRCRDPKDDKFLALARVCEADLMISSDADLLAMHPWHGLSVLAPGDFMAAGSEPQEPRP